MRNRRNPTTLRSDTRAVGIDGTPDQVFDFLADPENLPKWAVGFCHSIRRDGDHWMVTTAGGEVGVRYVTDRGLYALQNGARTGRLGLWADAAPTAPWTWRANKKH